ncbi:MAG: glycosyltransferase family 4 protein [Bacteroidia bacterium]|nr:glycosyltransferase family 4 protein [Bacteroidia bacterium]
MSNIPQCILLMGSGGHTHLLYQALLQARCLQAAIEYYPEWRLVTPQGVLRHIPLYRHVVHWMWALWRRLPYRGQFEHPRTWHFALYDWLASRHFPEDAQLLWAWSGTSLYTMRKAQHRGIPIFLEFPAPHPRFWNRIAFSIYQQDIFSSGKFGILPESLIRRQVAEIELADRIVVLSSFARTTMIDEGVPPQKLTVLPLGTDPALFTPSNRLSRKPFRVLYVGRIDPLKGIHLLLKAWKALNFPYAELWLVGNILPEMKGILAQYEGTFRYLGAIPHHELPPIYQQATLLVFPTLMDSFGLVLVEAMASGLPIIATTTSAAPDLLQEGLIPPNEIESLMKALELFYKHPELEEIGRANRATVLRNYTLQHYYNRVAELLSQAISLVPKEGKGRGRLLPHRQV